MLAADVCIPCTCAAQYPALSVGTCGSDFAKKKFALLPLTALPSNAIGWSRSGTLQALDHVECLYEYWRQWRLRLSEVFEEAKVGERLGCVGRGGWLWTPARAVIDAGY